MMEIVDPEDVVEAPEGSYHAPLHGWTCFHCGEEFSILKQGSYTAALKEAKEHFGPDPRWTPLCLEKLAKAPRKMWRALRRAEMRLAEFHEIEEQVDHLQNAARERDELRCRVDSLEGELEVERLRLREAR
jgi:hypothetical protein